MHNKPKIPLATGQMWEVKAGYVQITHIGKTLAEYKMLKLLGQRAVKSQTGSLVSIEAWLKQNRAKLISSGEIKST
jgi:hypothetical protein